MKWLITGGCGFIGTRLIETLSRDKSQALRIVDNLSVGTRADLAAVCRFTEFPSDDLPDACEGIQLIAGDILDSELALQTAKGMDVVVHLAAATGVAPSVENPRFDCLTNVVGTLNILEGARTCSVKRFIFASSGAPLGEVCPPIHEEIAPHPASPYGASKLAGEGYCSAYYKAYGMETVILRFGNVYGPGSAHKTSVVAKFIKSALAGEPLTIFGDGLQSRDFIYIDDLISAIQLAAQVKGIGGEAFQIASAKETTVVEMLDELTSILRAKGLGDISIRKLSMRPGDVKQSFSDTSKARTWLGWEPKVKLGEGLSRTVAYFLNRTESRSVS